MTSTEFDTTVKGISERLRYLQRNCDGRKSLVDCKRAERAALISIYKIMDSGNEDSIKNAEIWKMLKDKLMKKTSKGYRDKLIKIVCYIFDKNIIGVNSDYKTITEVREKNSNNTSILTYCRHVSNTHRRNGRCYAPNCKCPIHFAANRNRLFHDFLRTKRKQSLRSPHSPNSKRFLNLIMGCESVEFYHESQRTRWNSTFPNAPPYELAEKLISTDEIKCCSSHSMLEDPTDILRGFNVLNTQPLFDQPEDAKRYGYDKREYVNRRKRDDPCSEEHELVLKTIEFAEEQIKYAKSLVSEFLSKRLSSIERKKRIVSSPKIKIFTGKNTGAKSILILDDN